MGTAPLLRFTEAQYLRYEKEAQQKHEFVHGNIVAMAGAGMKHNGIAMNLASSLSGALRDRSCLVVGSDQRCRIQPGALYFYPDVTVVCAPVETLPTDADTLLNPVVVVEVLSPSTRRHDFEGKLPAYRDHPTIREILMVEPGPVWIQHWYRSLSGEWQMRTIDSLDGSIALNSLRVELSVAEVYRNAELMFDPSAE